MGKPSEYVPTDADCSQCRLTNGFLPAMFVYKGIVDNRQSCHGGVTALSKNADHIPTISDRSNCHTTAVFISDAFYCHPSLRRLAHQ